MIATAANKIKKQFINLLTKNKPNMKKIIYSLALLSPLAAIAGPVSTGNLTMNSKYAPKVSVESRFDGAGKSYVGALRAEEEPTVQIVKEAPAGKHEVFARSGEGWYMPFYAPVRVSYDYYGMELVTTDDGTVYMRNPQASFATDSYIVGYKEGDKITFEFPQAVYAGYAEWNDTNYVYYAVMLDYVSESSTTGTYKQADEQVLTFSQTAEGGWKMDGPADGAKLFGMVDHEGEWFGFGDWGLTFTPFKDQLLEAPEGLKTEKWALKYSGDGHFVDVGIDGNDMWIKGMYPECPESWVKGQITDRRVIFEGGQYIGMDPVDYYHNYFYGATIESSKEGYKFNLSNQLRFDYDKANKTLKTDMYAAFNSHPTDGRIHDALMTPEIAYQPKNICLTPMKIDVLDYYSYDTSEGVGGILHNINKYNVYGQLLDQKGLYYRIIIDDEYLEIDPAQYPKVEEAMIDIPYFYVDYDKIFTHEFYFVVRDYDYMGMRAIYKDGDKIYYGPIANVYGTMPDYWDTVDLPDYTVPDDPDSIEGVYDAEVVEEIWTNLMGVRVSNPEKGIFIRTVKYSDGRVNSSKVVK